MSTPDTVVAQLRALIESANGVTGNKAADLTTAVAALIAGFGQGGSGGVKVTEYVVTEDADRSLWLNEQKINLVKGVNLLLIGRWLYGGGIVNSRSGMTMLAIMLWDGIEVSESEKDTTHSDNHLRGFFVVTNGYSMLTSFNSFIIGDTKKLSVDDNGMLTFTTSATGVTTGVYANSFMGAGNTYYLLQVESEVVC